MTTNAMHYVTDGLGFDDRLHAWDSTETFAADGKKSPTLRRRVVLPALLACATLTTPFGHDDPTLELQKSGASSTASDFEQFADLKIETDTAVRVSRKEARAIALKSAAEVRARVLQSRTEEAQFLRELYDAEHA